MSGIVQPELSWEPDSGMIDVAVCSCGWKSHPYFDGAPYAEKDWKKHAAQCVLEQEVRLGRLD